MVLNVTQGLVKTYILYKNSKQIMKKFEKCDLFLARFFAFLWQETTSKYKRTYIWVQKGSNGSVCFENNNELCVAFNSHS